MKHLAFIFTFLFFANGYAQNKFTITANISGVDSGFACLQYTSNEGNRIDSVPVSKEIHFKGTALEKTFAYFYLSSNSNDVLPIFISSAKIQIDVNSNDIDLSKVKGDEGSATNDYEDYRVEELAIQQQLAPIEKLYDEANKKEDKAKALFYEAQYDSIDAEAHTLLIEKFIARHPNSIYAPTLFRYLIRYGTPASLVLSLYEQLSKDIKESKDGKELSENINAYAKVAIGKPAPSFTQKDVNGKDVDFSQVNKGKVLLLDFWASWCGPCRRENPNVVLAYEKYHSKGFEILGVSLDKDDKKWKAAIEKDKLGWQHLSDLKGWDNEVAKMYVIRAIPSNLLIDEKGIIIAKNLRGEALERKLEELLK